MKISLVFATLFVAGCATQSGVVPIGKGNYTITHQGGSGLTTTAELKTAVLQRADAYCVGTNKKLDVIHTKETPAAMMRFPEVELVFTCN